MHDHVYNPKEIEPRWRKFWESAGLYQSDAVSDKEKEYILVEFPYPSGAGLHVGHVWGYTMGDVIARRARMNGKNVLYPMGWDAFGLPTENYAIKTGIHPAIATAQNIETFKDQMERLGFSFDWTKEINTTDPSYYKWTQWIFLKLFEKGLAYKQEMPINWCPSCKTGLANEEVTSENTHERCGNVVERRMILQWLLKITEYADRLIDDLSTVDYTNDIVSQQVNWIGRSEGSYIKFTVSTDNDKYIEVFTTRADTLPGVTFVVLSPEHPLVADITTKENQEEVEKYCESAFLKSELERSQLQKEKTGVFTGGYVINPLNGEKVPVWVADYVLFHYGTGAVMGVPAHDERDMAFATLYDLPVVEVPDVGEDASKHIIGLLSVNGMAREGVEYKLRDWIFSRQHYWGEPIPIINCKKCGLVPVPEDQLPVTLPNITDFEPTIDGRSPLAKVTDWVNVTCPACGGPAERETDTMPNWAGSSWYFLRYVDPHNTDEFASRKKLDYMTPVDLYIGGAEHTTLHVLYSRFWHKVLFDLGYVSTAEPYSKRRNRGLILAPDGNKMSKSLGNVINPNDEVDAVGADTLRMYELFMGPYNETFPWNPSAEKGIYRFIERVYALTYIIVEKNSNITSLEIDQKIHKTIEKVSADLDSMKFNTAIAALMECVNVIERNPRDISISNWGSFIKLLAPFAPFAAEEMWSVLCGKLEPYESIHAQSWPELDRNKLIEDTITIPIQVNGKLRDTINVSSGDITEETVVGLAKASTKIMGWIGGSQITKTVYVPGKMVNFVIQQEG